MSQTNLEICPRCNMKGQSVDNATVKSLIGVSLHRVNDIRHRFCVTSDCPVAYFAEDDSEIFYTHELRERIYQKEPDTEDILVCYCFFHTLGDIKASADLEGENSIIQDIKVGIQKGKCACDWRNPQGKCCLGNVIEIVKNNTS